MLISKPITPLEQPHLSAMGTRIKMLRLGAGMTRQELAFATGLSAQHIYRLERGLRRTRQRTLAVLVDALGHGDGIVDELVALAGPALAEESPSVERIEKRRQRRLRRNELITQREAYRLERQAIEAEWQRRIDQHLEFRALLRSFDAAFDWLRWAANPSARRRPRRQPPRLLD